MTDEILEATSDLSERMFNETRMETYVSAYCTAKRLYQAQRALAFAKEKHDGQMWKTKQGQEQIPYIFHPLMITCHALALGLEEDDLLSACLLHDVCEDCGVTPEELPVNDRTREAVRLLTKPEGYRNTEEEKKIYYDGIAGDRIAMIVKLLDRCINVSSMANIFTDERMAEYISETHRYLYPFFDKVRREYPEYSNQMFLVRYHMNSVIDALDRHLAPVPPHTL